MAKFNVGGYDQFAAMAYPQPSQTTTQFIDHLNQQVNPSMATSQMAAQFLEKSKEAYENLMGSTAIRKMKAAARTMNSLWQENVVRELRAVDEMQQAPTCMRRYIMAEPTVRDWYYQQRLDGYSQSYVDPFPRVQSGEDHYDYRRVMDGLLQGEGDDLYFLEYDEQLLDGDEPLMAEDQFAIQNTWSRMVTQLFKGNDDPTSPYNAEL